MVNFRKGYVHTLEGVIAFFLIMGYVLFFLPALKQKNTTPLDFQQEIYTERIETLLKSGKLDDYINSRDAAHLSQQVSDMLDNTNVVVWLDYVNTTAYWVESPENITYRTTKNENKSYYIATMSPVMQNLSIGVNGVDIIDGYVNPYTRVEVTGYIQSGENNITVNQGSSLWLVISDRELVKSQELPVSSTIKIINMPYSTQLYDVVLYVFVY